MAVNTVAGIQSPIQMALTTGPLKTPLDAAPLTRVRLQLFDRQTAGLLETLDSDVTANIFFWTRTQKTVKGVLVFILEMELHATGIIIQDDLIARLTLYDGPHPNGIEWKQFALNSR